MNSFTLKHNRLYNPTKLYTDYLAGGLQEYYRYNYSDPESINKAADQINSNIYDREKLHQIVLNGNQHYGASDKTLSNIELLKQPDTLCIFAGQQTALCCHPMYIIYKAFTAVKLASRYSQILNRPVVPCFWMASDDHDFEEVRKAGFLLRSGELKTITYQPKSDPSGSPIADIAFDDGINNYCESVQENLIGTEFREPLIQSFAKYFRPGIKLSEAFASVFNQFIGDDWGIILVDPSFQGMKELFKPVFSKEIIEHNQVYRIYKQRTDNLLKNGYHAQVHKTDENLNLFYHHKAKRLNLKISNNRISPDGIDHSFSSQELNQIAQSSPERFSANVLLRPIAQGTAFPTLCQVVGPSELAYFAQIEPLFDFFNVPQPVIHPRAGMTIVEPHIKRITDKYKINLPDIKSRLEPLLGEVVESLYPSEAANSILSIGNCLNQDLEGFAAKLKDTDPEGYRHIINFRGRIDFELKQLQKKLKNSNKKRHDALTSQMRKAYAFLFPEGNFQERVVSPLYYANKFGADIFTKIYDNLDIDEPVHSVLEL